MTHDQEEALTMSDRISVMSNGRVEQVGSPEEVYEEPATAYVADFLGVSNLMNATAKGSSGRGPCTVSVGDFEMLAAKGTTDAFGDVKVTIRPERVLVEAHGTTGQNRIPGMIERTVYLGSFTQLIINLAHGERLQAVLQNRGEALPFSQGTPVVVSMPPDALRVLPLAGARAEAEAERG
ncbi:MAG: TOBE domain-containing protein [Actinobacteria bacterium]|nr:TOBE domain-containing protein [Actinomycetota bacterium]